MPITARFLLALVLCLPAAEAFGQAHDAASREVDLSTYSGITRTDSGASHGSSLGLTLGIDSFLFARPQFGIAAEIRVTAPLSASDVTESSAVVGVRVDHPMGFLHLSGDALYGRAQLNYAGDGMATPSGSIFYTQSRSTVYMLGVGASLNVSPTMSVHLDEQFERLSTPVTASGHALAIPFTIGVSYHLPYTKHGHAY